MTIKETPHWQISVQGKYYHKILNFGENNLLKSWIFKSISLVMKVFLHLEEIAFTELTKFEPPTLCLKLVRRNYKVRVIFKREIIWLNECFFFRSKIAYLFIISFSYESLFCNNFFWKFSITNFLFCGVYWAFEGHMKHISDFRPIYVISFLFMFNNAVIIVSNNACLGSWTIRHIST